MKKIAILLLVGTLGLCGCRTTGNAESTESVESTENVENIESVEDTERIETVETGLELFAELPDTFYFSSGAGGWGTELYLEKDGTFFGQFHDSDMGVTGEDYPNGTVYICNFNGKFTAPIQVDEYTYSTTIEYMNIERENEEYVENGMKYIVSDPYGLENSGEILIYLYGTPYQQLSEDFLSWMQQGDLGPDYLACFGLYNINEGTAFTGSIYEDFRELVKLGGTYINETGDKVVIHLADGSDEYSRELGYVDWIPHDGEAEHGTIMKNPLGGFTIYLDESISYSFKMTNYKYGEIEFSAANKWSEKFGTFVMQ